MPESTEKQMAKVEEELDEYQLLRRIDNARSWARTVGKLYYKEEQRKSTVDRCSSWEMLEMYFEQLVCLYENILIVKIRRRLEGLPREEQDAKLRRWASRPGNTDEYRLHELYTRRQPTDDPRKRIDEIRSDIAPKVMAIREALKAWDFKPTHALWPMLTTDELERSGYVASVDDSTSRSGEGGSAGSEECANCDPSTKKSTKKSCESNYQKLLAGHISIVLSKKPRVAYQDIAKRITSKDIGSLPPDFQNRMLETEFVGSLLEFFKQEERRREKGKEGNKGNQQDGPIDFRRRFMHSFSQAKRDREERMAAQDRSKK